jgi:hypothetical protein
MGTLTRQPLKPVITINKNDDATTYVFNPFTASYDFRLTALNVKPAYFGVAGSYDLTFVANAAANSAARTLLQNITEGYDLLIELGKTDGSKQQVLRGVIEKINVFEPNMNLMEITLSGFDWGTDLLSGRLISLSRTQLKQDDGKTPLATDLRTSIKNLQMLVCGYDNILGAASYEAYPGDTAQQRFSLIDQGLTVSSANITETGASVPKFEANLERAQEVLNSLDELANTSHYVTPAKELKIRPADDLGFDAPTVFLTDDVNDGSAGSYTYHGLIAPGATYIKDLENHRRRYFGVDSGLGSIDQANPASGDPTVSGTPYTTINDTYNAARFSPTKRKCSAIAIFVAKTGSPQPLIVELREAHPTDANPNGSRIVERQKIGTAIKTVAEVQADSKLGWHYFSVNDELNTKTNYFIVVVPPNTSSDPANVYHWFYTALTGGTSSSGADGITWSGGTVNYAYRQDYTDDYQIIAPGTGVTASQKHVYEDVVRKPSLTDRGSLDRYLTAQLRKARNKKEILQCRVYSPDTLMTVGQQVILKKQQSGVQITTTGTDVNPHFTVTSITYNFSAGETEQDGVMYLDVELSRFVPYS